MCAIKFRFQRLQLLNVIFSSRALLLLIGSTKLISGVRVEGWEWGNRGNIYRPYRVDWNSRVTHYSVEFSPDGRLWTVIKDENGLPRVRDINESLITLSLRRACLHFHACFCCMKRLEISPPFPCLGCYSIEQLSPYFAV